MSRFQLKMDCDNAAFHGTHDDDIPTCAREECARILESVAGALKGACDSGVCMDYNGNKVGEWDIETGDPDTDEADPGVINLDITHLDTYQDLTESEKHKFHILATLTLGDYLDDNAAELAEAIKEKAERKPISPLIRKNDYPRTLD